MSTPDRLDRAASAPDVDAPEQLARSFKRAMAAVRRLRGLETPSPRELTDAQYGLLFSLREKSQLSLRELATAAELSPASATEMLDALAEEGLVERIRSERDRRVVLTSLTPDGLALVEARRAQFEPRFRAALASFGDEQLVGAATVLEALRDFFDDLADERRREVLAETPTPAALRTVRVRGS